MITREFRQAVIKTALLNAQAEAFVQWHREALESLVHNWPRTKYDETWNSLSETERRLLMGMTEKLPGPDEFLAMERLIRSLTNGELARLNAEDRAYMAEVRCRLDDALDHARHGEFAEAYHDAVQGWERIDWVLNGRKRSGAHRRSILNLEMQSALADARDGVGEIVTELKQAHLALAK